MFQYQKLFFSTLQKQNISTISYYYIYFATHQRVIREKAYLKLSIFLVLGKKMGFGSK